MAATKSTRGKPAIAREKRRAVRATHRAIDSLFDQFVFSPALWSEREARGLARQFGAGSDSPFLQATIAVVAVLPDAATAARWAALDLREGPTFVPSRDGFALVDREVGA